MGGSLPARKGDHQIGHALAQHPFVAYQRRVPPFFLPTRRELHEIDSSLLRPLASNSADAARVALDYSVEVVLRVELIEFGMYEMASLNSRPPQTSTLNCPSWKIGHPPALRRDPPIRSS
jgi:hypothetical protein